jgi:hypothetical protein
MKSTPFDPHRDYAPIPFDLRVLEAARALKDAGLPWRPHVGCFVWDPDEHMPVPSPFPERVYFVLNIGRFTELLGSVEAMQEKLVWVPTWTQAQALLAEQASASVSGSGEPGASDAPAAEGLLSLYDQLRRRLEES